MNYELNLTTSPLRGTPPKNYFVIFKRRVAALIGSIVPTIHCVAGGELGADAHLPPGFDVFRVLKVANAPCDITTL